MVDSEGKKYHAFISHSSQDKDTAKRLALDLQGRGFSVWFDEWEVLVGHNIVDEVFGAIKQSHFMVVVLSEASVQSRWVDEEMTAAKTREIEDQEVVILPVKIDSCEIPPALAAKRYADFTASWDYGVQEIIRAIEGHQGNLTRHPTIRLASPRSSISRFDALDQWRESLVPEMIDAGFVEGHPFKDVLIGPIDGASVTMDRTLLGSIVDTCRVRLDGWGGLPFPFEKSSTTQQVHLQSGLRHVDPQLRLYGTESFHFWQIDSRLNLMHRSPIAEDFVGSDRRGETLAGKLARSYSLVDIICPLLFARNLLSIQTDLGRVGVKFVWGGLNNRSLVDISSSLIYFLSRYQCQVPVWDFQTVITSESSIVAEARKAANDLFWLFDWEPNAEAQAQELELLSNGSFSR